MAVEIISLSISTCYMSRLGQAHIRNPWISSQDMLPNDLWSLFVGNVRIRIDKEKLLSTYI